MSIHISAFLGKKPMTRLVCMATGNHSTKIDNAENAQAPFSLQALDIHFHGSFSRASC
jgi:hypothetical protein